MHRLPQLSCIITLAVLTVASSPPSLGAEKSAPAISERKKEKALRDNDRAAQEAMARDMKLFNGREFRELETDYQAANARYREADAKPALEAFLKKWTKGNRVGCATLYLAQKSGGEEREKLLRQCIADYSDCYYLNGAQVGGLARLQLWDVLKTAGKNDEASKLLAEIKDKFALANNHAGQLLIEIIDAQPQ